MHCDVTCCSLGKVSKFVRGKRVVIINATQLSAMISLIKMTNCHISLKIVNVKFHSTQNLKTV